MDTLFIGAYWSKRAESQSDCAIQLSQFLNRIGEEHRLLRNWYKRGQTRDISYASHIDIAPATLEPLLRLNVRDTDKKPIPELGYRFAAWNGDLNDPSSVSVTFGAYSNVVGNSIVLQLPRTMIEGSPVLSDGLLKIIVQVWKPERTVVQQIDGALAERFWS